MCSVSGWAPPLQQSSGLSSPGTSPVVPETPLCASGTSALRRPISHAKVSMQLATSGVLLLVKWLAQQLLVGLRRSQPISILFTAACFLRPVNHLETSSCWTDGYREELNPW